MPAKREEPISKERLEELVGLFPGRTILVVGDVMLDEFVWGNVSRISPEAPVPVVEVERESYFPGGAANVARNLAEFTENVHLMAVTGRDAPGDRLRGLLAERNIRLDALYEADGFPTIVKTRIIARHQQVVRVDRELVGALEAGIREKALADFRRMLPGVDAVIFEDYGKGFISQGFADGMLRSAEEAGCIVTLDPNPRNRITWRSITAATPNRSEAFAAAGAPWSEPVAPPAEDRALIEVGACLLDVWTAGSVVVTLGEQGMMVFQRGEEPYHIPTLARDVFDVSGAGDTAIAVFTLALASGGTAVEAAQVSNRASGIVVGKLGTATTNAAEILGGA